jgi:hypothetical protein
MILVALILILDMILLPILVGANFEGTAIYSFKGKHTDFDAEWYPNVGRSIVVLMYAFTF